MSTDLTWKTVLFSGKRRTVWLEESGQGGRKGIETTAFMTLLKTWTLSQEQQK